MYNSDVPESLRTQKMSKFVKKFLICTCGKPSTLFVTANTKNGQMCLEHCLHEQLFPFLKAHDGPINFWPDLAACHNAKNVL